MMRRQVMIVLMPLLLLPLPSPAQASKARAGISPQAQVVGLEIGKRLPKAVAAGLLLPFWGTELRVLMSCPGWRILGVDFLRSKLVAFRDNLGTDLVGTGGQAMDWFMNPSADVSGDGQFCTVAFRGGAVPARGATHVLLVGRAVLHCGALPKTAMIRDVSLTPDSQFSAGQYLLTIQSVRPSTSPWARGFPDALEVTVVPAPRTAGIWSIRFLDSAGKEVGSSQLPSTGKSYDAEGMMDETILVKKPVERVTAEVRYFDRVTSVPVAFDFRVPVGF